MNRGGETYGTQKQKLQKNKTKIKQKNKPTKKNKKTCKTKLKSIAKKIK